MVTTTLNGSDIWRSTSLGELISLRRGHDLTWRQRDAGHVPVMGSAGQNGFHNQALAHGPGVVLGRSGASFGQAHYCETDFWPHNTALYVTDFRGNEPRFIYYLLDSIDFTQHNSGGAQQSLNRNFIASIALSVPPPSEQARISKTIDDASDLISSIERSLAKKQAIKYGMMQQLLTGRTRIPGFTSQWTSTSLGEVATLQRGFDLPTRIRKRGTIPVVSSSGVSGWHNQTMVKAPGVVTGRYGTIGGVFFETVDFWPLNTTLWVSNFHGNDARFIYYLLQRVDFASHSGKSGVPGVNRNDLHSELVSIPDSVAEQQAIAKALDDAEEEHTALQNRLTKALAIKQGMMQQLLTGRTRLPIPEAAA